jgi:hypothetical protein
MGRERRWGPLAMGCCSGLLPRLLAEKPDQTSYKAYPYQNAGDDPNHNPQAPFQSAPRLIAGHGFIIRFLRQRSAASTKAGFNWSTRISNVPSGRSASHFLSHEYLISERLRRTVASQNVAGRNPPLVSGQRRCGILSSDHNEPRDSNTDVLIARPMFV